MAESKQANKLPASSERGWINERLAKKLEALAQDAREDNIDHLTFAVIKKAGHGAYITDKSENEKACLVNMILDL